MITVGELRKLLGRLPDATTVIACEGVGRGLSLEYKDVIGWIETGFDEVDLPDVTKHDLKKITQKVNRDFIKMLKKGDKESIKIKKHLGY